MSRIVAIDLGTSTSEIACIVDGKPVIIPNTLGKYVTPSVVHIEKDGSKLIGEPAAEYLLTRPDCTFMEVKRLTGSGEVLMAHGKSYTPEDIQAMLLRYLVSCAEMYFDEKITRAVITVPAYFTDAQRRATAKAGELAGLTVERILNEPTAAAMDYGLQNMSECKNVLVYDLGGGTLDITVLELFEGVIDVKASRGNNSLGGKDFDEIIMRRIADARGDARALMRLKKAAEDCKIALSESDSFDISLPFLFPGKRAVSVEKTVTRGELEDWIFEKVQSTREPMMAALADAGLSPGDLDVALLVGGSTRIPCVRRLVKESLGIEPSSFADPELTVVRGASVQAGVLEGIFEPERELVLTDVCPYTLGVESMHSGYLEDILVCSTIIPRNTTIPVERSEFYSTFADYQTSVDIKIYQGDSIEPEKNEFLGKMTLTGIPPARRGKESVKITFSYDVNGILQVSASSVSTGKQVETKINTVGTTPISAIDITQWDKSKIARRYRPVIRKAEKLLAQKGKYSELRVLITMLKEEIILENEECADELREDLIRLMEELKTEYDRS